MESINWFFSNEEQDGRISSLSKALNELKQMEDAGLNNSQAYCMFMWIIVDLLSRFYSGQLDNQRATNRLKNYLKQYFPHHRQHTNDLILFRNACAHSVTLFSSDGSGKKELRFRLTTTGDFIQTLGQATRLVNTVEMKNRLLRSIEKYQSDLNQDPRLQAHFDKTFKKLGYVKL